MIRGASRSDRILRQRPLNGTAAARTPSSGWPPSSCRYFRRLWKDIVKRPEIARQRGGRDASPSPFLGAKLVLTLPLSLQRHDDQHPALALRERNHRLPNHRAEARCGSSAFIAWPTVGDVVSMSPTATVRRERPPFNNSTRECHSGSSRSGIGGVQYHPGFKPLAHDRPQRRASRTDSILALVRRHRWIP